MNRRDFIRTPTMAAIFSAYGISLQAEDVTKRNDRPNILFIMTDQQSASMMSCGGNKWLKTPTMDYIAENGIRLTSAYMTNPVSVPARVVMMTGRFPGSFNDKNDKPARENSGGWRIGRISKILWERAVIGMLN